MAFAELMKGAVYGGRRLRSWSHAGADNGAIDQTTPASSRVYAIHRVLITFTDNIDPGEGVQLVPTGSPAVTVSAVVTDAFGDVAFSRPIHTLTAGSNATEEVLFGATEELLYPFETIKVEVAAPGAVSEFTHVRVDILEASD